MLTRIAAGLTVALGAALLVWTLTSSVGFALPLIITLAAGGLLEIGLGIGLAKKSRAAWSFALAAAGVGSLTLLLAVPAIQRAGASVVFAAAALLIVLLQLVLLILAKDQF